MASEYTFRPKFEEYVTLYRGVAHMWIGNGDDEHPENPDFPSYNEAGVLYAEYVNELVQVLGPVTDYYYAVQQGYEGTFAEWVQFMLDTAEHVINAERWATGGTGAEYTVGNSAKEQADRAATLSNLADQRATAAAVSETNAAQSASNASISETNAAQSASNASTSEVNASASETNASTSELNAAQSASNASASASSASADAATATSARTDVLAAEQRINNTLSHAQTVYANSSTGSTPPPSSATWTQNPVPEHGSYLWAKTSFTWTDDQGQEHISYVMYTSSYWGMDGNNLQYITEEDINGLFS